MCCILFCYNPKARIIPITHTQANRGIEAYYLGHKMIPKNGFKRNDELWVCEREQLLVRCLCEVLTTVKVSETVSDFDL